MNTVLMIGEGAWGTAVATVLAGNGIPVKLWCNDSRVAQDIHKIQINTRYLPEITLSHLIEPFVDLEQIDKEIEYVFISTPIKYFRAVAARCTKWYAPHQKWIVLSKGIENDSLLLPVQILKELFGESVQAAVVMGPSFAGEVARKQLTAVNLGMRDYLITQKIQALLTNDFFHVYYCDDLIGMQIGGALKNVIALGIGILDGAGYGDNTKAFFLTQALHEIMQMARLFGGKQETIYGLSGLGDMVLTCTSEQSRNRRVGRAIGQGHTVEQILIETGYTPEGVNTACSLYQLAEKMNIELPLCAAVWKVVAGQARVDELECALIKTNLS